VKAGSPWVYSNEVVMDRTTKSLAGGTLVNVVEDRGAPLATAYFNPVSLIAARVLTREPDAPIDATFFRDRFERADALRRKLIGTPYYRMVHAEADDCPGLVVDRFDDVFVAQSGTAGMDALSPLWLEALRTEFKPRAIVIKSNAGARAHEGMKDDVRIVHGDKDVTAYVEEAGVRHIVDPVHGQKTGWFFDQRDNRAFLVAIAKGATVLDAYSYVGALALGAAKAGAKAVVLLDSSQAALDAAARTATANGLDKRCEFRRCDVLEELEELGPSDERFDIVACDPPPFVRSKKDLESGARGYRKLARLAAALVAPGGFLALSSCSHAIDAGRFAHECTQGIFRAGRTGRVVHATGAAPDHPVHPLLPETAYLKSLVYQLD
jgi:23S rRNA (cytosine1962-C5)-methyltransferase